MNRIAEKITKDIMNEFKAIDDFKRTIVNSALSIKFKAKLVKELIERWKELEKQIGENNLTLRDVIELEKKKSSDIPKDKLNKFMNILVNMSPENLSWDGERSPREQKLALQKLQQEWKRLEREVGRKVSMNEIYKYMAGL